MKITILALFALCLCTMSSLAQNNTHSIKGAVADTAAMARLTGTVTVLTAKDSILVKYVHAVNNGMFAISDLPAGKYLLLVTYPDYADYVEAFTLDPLNKEHDFGNINMQLKSSILKEVIIKGDATAIELHGDTTVFNAKAYIVQPNAKVEELLKQFPGIEIDSKGKIKANGEEVKKMLVDGEEFFGDDPTLVTRNLRADMVDKVELFDKKSDQAAFTGIDDGKKPVKTMNVILKEDKKKGVFGKVSGGVGTDKYYEGQGIYNQFAATQKVSVYGTTANDGTTGLGSADNSKIGAGISLLASDGGYLIGGSTYDQLDNSTYGGTGFPVARNAGAHYDGKWDKNLQSINGNYRIGSLGVNTETANLSQQSLPGAIITNNSEANGHTYFFRQKANGMYTYNPNINTSLRVTVDGGIRNNESQNSSVNRSSSSVNGGDDELKYIRTSNTSSKGQEKAVDASIFFSKRLKKPRRTFSLSVDGAYNENESKNYNIQEVFTQSTLTDTVTNQFKPNNSSTAFFSSNATYTEPISKRFSAAVSYGADLNNSHSDLESYNQSVPGSGNYDQLDPDYSNNYKFNQFINKAGLNFTYQNGTKATVVFGTRVYDVNFKQIDINSGQIFKRDFTNWNPSARLQYNITPTQTLSVSYNGNNYQPGISQIQPVKNNTDVTTIYIGNADLKASFRQYFSVVYNQYQQVSNSGFRVSGSYNLNSNTIINKQSIDANNISTIQYVNLADKSPYSYYGNISRDLRSTLLQGIHLYFTLNTSGYVNYNYVNNDLDRNSNQSYSFSFKLNRVKKNKHTVNVTVAPTYSFNHDQLQPSFNYHTPGFYTTDDVTIYITKKLQLYTDIDYTYTAKTRSLPARNYTMWNGALSETFLKEDNLKVSLSGNNLLNQDYNRTSQNGSTITQFTTNSIKRYFMLSVSWDFTKFGTTADKK